MTKSNLCEYTIRHGLVSFRSMAFFRTGDKIPQNFKGFLEIRNSNKRVSEKSGIEP